MHKAEVAHTQPNNLEIPAEFTGMEDALFSFNTHKSLMHLSCTKFNACIIYTVISAKA